MRQPQDGVGESGGVHLCDQGLGAGAAMKPTAPVEEASLLASWAVKKVVARKPQRGSYVVPSSTSKAPRKPLALQ